MNANNSGNSIIPSDKVFDAYYAPRCEECGLKLTDREQRKSEFICDICEEILDNEDDEE